MIDFKYNGIKIAACILPEPYEYEIEGGKKRMTFDKNVCVYVKFWNFIINGNIYDLSFVKSVCTYFMQAYWKRSTKDGTKINMEEILEHKIVGKEYTTSSLCFSAVQGNKTNKLRIRLKHDMEIVEEIFLTGREVIQLDINIGKAINLLQPAIIRDPQDLFES